MLSNYLKFLYIYKRQIGGKQQKYWDTLSHNAVLFPPDYEKKNIPVIKNNEEILLNKEAEEAAFFYAKYVGSEYLKNPKFNKNFWNDFKKLLDSNIKINSLEEIDFSRMKDYLEKERMKRLDMTKEQKEEIKNKTKEKEDIYKYAVLDGKNQEVGNFRIEPPSIFIGRGCHPQIGKIKRRVYPKDITINIGREAEIPKHNYEGQKWGKIIHDKSVSWLASWDDNITGKIKYVRLGDYSDFKSESDINKFELARKLKKKLGEIRKLNDNNLISDSLKMQQLSTGLYLIENFSLRVGNEKNIDEADTVGVSSLRVEHITLLERNRIKLDFLGKDSVRYSKKIEVNNLIFNNIKSFIEGKKKKDPIFDKMSPSDLNSYLQKMMTGLTTKVFRTMNASKLFQKELNKVSTKFENYDKEDRIILILDEYNKANAKVAILCNHQKNINKNFSKSINLIMEKIKKYKKKRKILEDKKTEYKMKNKDTKSVKSKIIKIDMNIKKLKSKRLAKTEMKNVSLGTSKVNYIDPRITVAFMKKNNLDINKLFSNTLQLKFKWALDVDDSFAF